MCYIPYGSKLRIHPGHAGQYYDMGDGAGGGRLHHTPGPCASCTQRSAAQATALPSALTDAPSAGASGRYPNRPPPAHLPPCSHFVFFPTGTPASGQGFPREDWCPSGTCAAALPSAASCCVLYLQCGRGQGERMAAVKQSAASMAEHRRAAGRVAAVPHAPRRRQASSMRSSSPTATPGGRQSKRKQKQSQQLTAARCPACAPGHPKLAKAASREKRKKCATTHCRQVPSMRSTSSMLVGTSLPARRRSAILLH